MKLNLPSARTNPKISSLLLLTLVHLPVGEAGNAFRNCLRYQHNGAFYDMLLKFPSNTITKNFFNLCCSGIDCRECEYQFGNFRCHKNPDGNVFCIGNACGGIIGESLITSNYSNINSSTNLLCKSTNVTKLIQFLATNPPTGLDQGYALQWCSVESGCLGWCNWDNGGWLCFTDHCYMQLLAPWPGSADKHPDIYAYTRATTSTTAQTSALPESTNLPEQNNHSTEKIWIPVAGSVTGTGLLTGLTYYYCKKKKRKQKTLKATENSQAELNNHKAEATEVIELTDRESPSIQEVIDTTKVEVAAENNNELATLTPPSSPLPQRAPQQLISINPKELLLNRLRTKLTGHEQLWTDYCEANQLLVSNPNSKVIIDSFNNYQNQLLQILTLGEIMMLLENNHAYVNQSEYIEAIEVAARSPQVIRYGSPQQWN